MDQETIWTDIWVVVEQLINATLNEDEAEAKQHLLPRSSVADMLDLHGMVVLEILLKTILEQPQITLMRAIEADDEHVVHLEYAWITPQTTKITATNVVTVTLKKQRQHWRVVTINPAPAEAQLNEPRAQMALATTKTERGEIPSEAWVLPYMLYAGALQLTLRPEAMLDEVEALLLPGLQARTHAVFALAMGRKLWRDFKKKGKLVVTKPHLYAAGIEYVLSELAGRKISPATVAKFHKLPLAKVLPIIRRIKETLKIVGNDSRYMLNAGIFSPPPS